jgi:hypothetical protein
MNVAIIAKLIIETKMVEAEEPERLIPEAKTVPSHAQISSGNCIEAW